MSDDYILNLIRRAKKCKNPNVLALIIAKIIEYFAPKDNEYQYSLYISKLKEILNEMELKEEDLNEQL